MAYEPTIWKTGDIVSSEKLNKLENSLASEESRAKSEETRLEQLFVTPTQEAVDNWLDVHPEATTTVEDGAITYEKLSTGLKAEIVNAYVTPEMYGAKGDGQTDDTTAIQTAIDTGKSVWLTKKYLTTGTLYLSVASGYFNNLGSITYTGTDYAVSFTGNVSGLSCNLGIIKTNSGGCVKLSTADGWKQYINIDFNEFQAKSDSNCVLIDNSTSGSWINEIRFKNGRFSRGMYAVFCTNATGTMKNHYNFYSVGFEGVTYGVMLDTLISNCEFYGCRCEEAVTSLFVTNANSYSGHQSVFWYGYLNLKFIDGLNYVKLYIYGNVMLKSGVYVNVNGILVYNNYLYGIEPFYSQKALGRWLQDESNNYYQETFDEMNTIASSGTLVNLIRLPNITINEQTATLKIDLNTIVPTGAMFNMISNTIMLLFTMDANTTLNIDDSNGNNLFSYTNTTGTTQYNWLGRLYYVNDWGLVFEINGKQRVKAI